MIHLNYNALSITALTLSFQIMILYHDIKKKIFGKNQSIRFQFLVDFDIIILHNNTIL